MNTIKWTQLLLLAITLPVSTFAQQKAVETVADWHVKDLEKDGVFGISMGRAYATLKGKKAQAVVVAVIDGGVDVEHKDLKEVIWTNTKEIPGNAKDDDGNGFIDDVHGWNFYSSGTAGDPEYDLRELFDQARKNPALQAQLEAKLLPYRNKVKVAQADKSLLEQILQKMGKLDASEDDFRRYVPASREEQRIQMEMVAGLKLYPNYVSYRLKQLERAAAHYQMELDYYEKQDYDLQTGGPTTHHGTHIAGIIAARGNVKGIANHAKIMVIRAIGGINPMGTSPEPVLVLAGSGGNAHDKAVANAIRYAVDNGAKVINMSFGPRSSFSSGLLAEAVRYAASKDVLMVHASGNQGIDLDAGNPPAADPEVEKCWIEVGASGMKDDVNLAAGFSNYGKRSVDVYAPGLDIYSTAPRSAYLTDTGTSMAAPVVSGLAAMLRAYYPKLGAAVLKEIILKSVVKRDVLKEKCVSGGVVNAQKALELAR